MKRDELNMGLLLFIPYRAMENAVLRATAAAGFDDVTPAQARVFQRIAAGGSRLTDLAEQAQITKQSAGFLIDQLEQGGYVRRLPDPDDGRARLIVVAERGAAAQAVAAEAVANVEQEWRRRLGSGDMGELRRILIDLRLVTDPYR